MSTAGVVPLVDVDVSTQLLDGVPLVIHAIDTLLRSGVTPVYIAAATDVAAAMHALAPEFPVLGDIADVDAVLDTDVDVVVVHDPLRPLVPPAVVASVIVAVRAGAAAAVPVIAVSDTVKKTDTQGRIVSTVDRDGL